MPDLLPVVVNRDGGTVAAMGDGAEGRLRAAFEEAGLRIALHLVPGANVVSTVAKVARAPMVAVGGGDGTLGSAAGILAAQGTTLAILPVGTRNHLAGELGIPADLVAAARTIADGADRRIDLASVNGHSFVNNASVGFYPLMVRWRDAERRRRGFPKWLATVPAVWATLGRLRHHRLYLRTESMAQRVRTPLLFVGNNRYQLERGRIGQRVALDDGLLSVFSVAASSRAGLVWFAARALVGHAHPERDFAAFGDCAELIVQSRSARVDIALDGEVRRLDAPLQFRVDPGGLRVRVPQPADAPAA